MGDAGTGTFIQTGGDNAINGILNPIYTVMFVGNASGSTGSYSLGGTGALNVNGGESIGNSRQRIVYPERR